MATVVPVVTQLFDAWGIATNQQAKAMDFLRTVSQQTAVPITKLTEAVVGQAPQLQLLGYNWQQAATLVSNFDKAGVTAQGGLMAFRKVLDSFAKEGVQDAAAEWKKLVEGVQSGTVAFPMNSRRLQAPRAARRYSQPSAITGQMSMR